MSTSTVDSGVRARRKQANYLDIGNSGTPSFTFMGRGFTELNESPSAQTKSKRYINMASATQSVSGYEPTWGFNTDQIRSEAVVDYICSIGEKRLTGSDAETDMVTVDLDRPSETGSTTKFHARKQRVAISISDFGDDDGDMTCEGDLLGVGDQVEGVFDTTARTFTDGWTEPAAPAAAPAVLNNNDPTYEEEV